MSIQLLIMTVILSFSLANTHMQTHFLLRTGQCVAWNHSRSVLWILANFVFYPIKKKICQLVTGSNTEVKKFNCFLKRDTFTGIASKASPSMLYHLGDDCKKGWKKTKVFKINSINFMFTSNKSFKSSTRIIYSLNNDYMLFILVSWYLHLHELVMHYTG